MKNIYKNKVNYFAKVLQVRNFFKLFTWFILFISLFIINSCKQEVEHKKLEKLAIGTPIGIITSVIWIAEAKKYFKQEGLDLTIKVYPSGKKSLQGMFKNEVELSLTAEVPFVFNSFKRNDIYLIATVGTSSNENKILARKDLAINKPGDLKGKTIGAQKGAAAHFFLHTFLTKYYLKDSVKVVFKKSKNLSQALANGEIDAYSNRNYFVQKGKEILGDKGIILESPGLYRKTFNLVSFKGYTKKKPKIIKKLLKALLKAEKFINDNRKESINILVKRSRIDKKVVAHEWDNFELGITLDQSLLLSMEEEARWIISSGLAKKKCIPNYLDYIYLDGLQSIKPKAVTILH